MISRKKFLVTLLISVVGVGITVRAFFKLYLLKILSSIDSLFKSRHNAQASFPSEIFLSRNGSPQANVQKVIELAGGIEKYINKNDIVVLKPNAQWWNHGRTNLAAMKGFIDLVLDIPDFSGEIIIGENHHFMDGSLENEQDNVRGWIHFSEINGDIDGTNHNLNTLIDMYQNAGYMNVTKSHWRDGGPKRDIWGNGQNGGIVKSPNDGDGYVWTDIDYEFYGYLGLKKWKVKMTYPVFTSAYSDITIDLHKGAFKRAPDGGQYLKDKAVKLINFAVLNNHGSDTGITSAVKNYMGIMDLSCGDWGLTPAGYVNVHQCGEGGHYAYAKGGPIGCFIKNICKADLNIVTAEWVGWGGRTAVEKASRVKTILASADPVALDCYSAKHIMLPLSKKPEWHDPDNHQSAVYKFLSLAAIESSSGILDEKNMIVKIYEFEKGKNKVS